MHGVAGTDSLLGKTSPKPCSYLVLKRLQDVGGDGSEQGPEG